MSEQRILEFHTTGRLLLGTWQGIYLWEHRTSAQLRHVVVTVLGQ